MLGSFHRFGIFPGLGISGCKYAENRRTCAASQLACLLSQFESDRFQNGCVRGCRQCPGQVGASLRALGINFECLLVLGNSIIQLSLLEKGEAEVIIGIGVAGFDFERFLVLRNSIIQLPVVQKGAAKIVVYLGIAGLDFERLAVLSDSLVYLSEQDIAKIGVASDIVR